MNALEEETGCLLRFLAMEGSGSTQTMNYLFLIALALATAPVSGLWPKIINVIVNDVQVELQINTDSDVQQLCTWIEEKLPFTLHVMARQALEVRLKEEIEIYNIDGGELLMYNLNVYSKKSLVVTVRKNDSLHSATKRLFHTYPDLREFHHRIIGLLVRKLNPQYQCGPLLSKAIAAWNKARPEATNPMRTQYLKLMAETLTGINLRIPEYHRSNIEKPFDFDARSFGLDWPMYGYSMVGSYRLQNIHYLLLELEKNSISGDFIEAGVWRGGSCIFATAVMEAYNMEDRKVFVADSFQGLPPSSQSKDENKWIGLGNGFLEVSQEEVALNFEAFGMLTPRVEFIEGFFRHSLPIFRDSMRSRARQIAFARLDADMYESTMDVLFNIFEFIPIGGIIVFDDFFTVPEESQAAVQFWELHGLEENFHDIDGSGVWWRKSANPPVRWDWYEKFNANRAASY